MEEIHEDLPIKEFYKPSGITERTICTVSGDLKSQKCPTASREVYKVGTEPTTFCEYHTFVEEARNDGIMKIKDLLEIEVSPYESIIDIEADIFSLDVIDDNDLDLISEGNYDIWD